MIWVLAIAPDGAPPARAPFRVVFFASVLHPLRLGWFWCDVHHGDGGMKLKSRHLYAFNTKAYATIVFLVGFLLVDNLPRRFD